VIRLIGYFTLANRGVNSQSMSGSLKKFLVLLSMNVSALGHWRFHKRNFRELLAIAEKSYCLWSSLL